MGATFDHLTDTALVARMGRGEEAALEAFYGRFGHLAYGLALKILGDEKQAGEVLVGAFSEMWRSASNPTFLLNPRSELLSLVKRQSAIRLRSAGRTVHASLPSDPAPQPTWVALEVQAARQLLDQLDDLEREALELAYYGCYTRHEIAAMLAISVEAATQRITTALRKLSELQHEGVRSPLEGPTLLAGSPARNPPYGSTPAVSVRRFVNDEILKVATRLDEGSTVFEFICECGNLKCHLMVEMTLADYRVSAPGSVVGHGEPGTTSSRLSRERNASALVQQYLVGEAVADAPYVVLVADEKMRFAAASDAASELLGYESDALLLLSVPDIVVERDEVPELFRDFIAVGEQRGRITLRCRNGELIDAIYFAHETTMADRPYFVSMLFPIRTKTAERDMLEDLFSSRSAVGHS